MSPNLQCYWFRRTCRTSPVPTRLSNPAQEYLESANCLAAELSRIPLQKKRQWLGHRRSTGDSRRTVAKDREAFYGPCGGQRLQPTTTHLRRSSILITASCSGGLVLGPQRHRNVRRLNQ